jgi:hypothetical protein
VICSRGSKFFLPKHSYQQWGPYSLLFSGYQGFFFMPRLRWACHELYHSPLCSAEHKNGAISVLPLYAFMVCSATTLCFKHIIEDFIYITFKWAQYLICMDVCSYELFQQKVPGAGSHVWKGLRGNNSK